MEEEHRDTEEVLHGGVANQGAVVRVGGEVLRPSNPFTPTIHRFLGDLRATGFDGASLPVGVDPDGRERLVFIPGDVPLAPFPEWFQTEDALASVAGLMARFHAASGAVGHDGPWSDEMVDRGARPDQHVVVCHNDVCPENVVFRDGVAVALLDFDFAAPGRPVYDLAQFVRMCVPVTDDGYAESVGFLPADRPSRVRSVCDAYEDAGGVLGATGRAELLAILDDSIARSGQWVQAKAAAGHPGFVAMLESLGGPETFDRRRSWWAGARESFASALA